MTLAHQALLFLEDHRSCNRMQSDQDIPLLLLHSSGTVKITLPFLDFASWTFGSISAD